jgi:hypothetical protein
MIWGGSARVEYNVFAWFWAIAEGGTPRDVSVAEVADALRLAGQDVADAERVRSLAMRIFDANVRTNQRSGERQRCHGLKRAELRRMATALGLRTTGFDTKADLTDMIVEARYPLLREPEAA